MIFLLLGLLGIYVNIFPEHEQYIVAIDWEDSLLKELVPFNLYAASINYFLQKYLGLYHGQVDRNN